MNSIRYLYMAENQLEGNIPEELGFLSELVSLELQNNQLATGSIPSQLGNLASLEDLNLTFNRLNGSIPQNLENLPVIKAFGFALTN